jgi:hypothetical protein
VSTISWRIFSTGEILKKKPLCETYHTAVFCPIQAQLAITDGCWSGTAMPRLEPTRFWRPAPAPQLVLQVQLPLALPLGPLLEPALLLLASAWLPLLELPPF